MKNVRHIISALVWILSASEAWSQPLDIYDYSISPPEQKLTIPAGPIQNFEIKVVVADEVQSDQLAEAEKVFGGLLKGAQEQNPDHHSNLLLLKNPDYEDSKNQQLRDLSDRILIKDHSSY